MYRPSCFEYLEPVFAAPAFERFGFHNRSLLIRLEIDPGFMQIDNTGEFCQMNLTPGLSKQESTISEIRVGFYHKYLQIALIDLK
jgi:hypothetical protein